MAPSSLPHIPLDAFKFHVRPGQRAIVDQKTGAVRSLPLRSSRLEIAPWIGNFMTALVDDGYMKLDDDKATFFTKLAFYNSLREEYPIGAEDAILEYDPQIKSARDLEYFLIQATIDHAKRANMPQYILNVAELRVFLDDETASADKMKFQLIRFSALTVVSHALTLNEIVEFIPSRKLRPNASKQEVEADKAYRLFRLFSDTLIYAYGTDLAEPIIKKYRNSVRLGLPRENGTFLIDVSLLKQVIFEIDQAVKKHRIKQYKEHLKVTHEAQQQAIRNQEIARRNQEIAHRNFLDAQAAQAAQAAQQQAARNQALAQAALERRFWHVDPLILSEIHSFVREDRRATRHDTQPTISPGHGDAFPIVLSDGERTFQTTFLSRAGYRFGTAERKTFEVGLRAAYLQIADDIQYGIDHFLGCSAIKTPLVLVTDQGHGGPFIDLSRCCFSIQDPSTITDPREHQQFFNQIIGFVRKYLIKNLRIPENTNLYDATINILNLAYCTLNYLITYIKSQKDLPDIALPYVKNFDGDIDHSRRQTGYLFFTYKNPRTNGANPVLQIDVGMISPSNTIAVSRNISNTGQASEKRFVSQFAPLKLKASVNASIDVPVVCEGGLWSVNTSAPEFGVAALTTEHLPI